MQLLSILFLETFMKLRTSEDLWNRMIAYEKNNRATLNLEFRI